MTNRSQSRREDYMAIEVEMREIIQQSKDLRSFGWVLGLISGGVALAACGAVWVFAPGAYPVLVPAIVIAAVGWAWYDLQSRIERMKMHAVTVHDQVLRTQELVFRYVVPHERQADAEHVVPQALDLEAGLWRR